jgi:hypothetical protein
MISNLPLSEQYRVAADQWVDADAAASILEELKTATLNQRMLALGDMAVNRAEMTVKASPDWKRYIEEMVAARTRANKLKVRMEELRMRYGETQSEEASRRAELRMTA